MNPINEVIKKIEGFGFSAIPNQKFNSSSEFYFSIDSDESQIKKYVAIRKLTRSNSTSFRFGFSHKKIRHFYKQIFPTYDFGIAKATELLSEERYKCWTTFPINKNLSESFTSVKNSGDEFQIFIESTLQAIVSDLIYKTNTDQQLLDCYLSEAGPFHWGMASGVFGRICEIAYLCHVNQSDKDAAMRCIERQFKYLKSDIYGCFADRDIFEKILASL